MQLSDTTFDGELWANVFGYMSIACWFVVFTPQLYENYCRKNTDGVSVQFLLLWIFGDIFNLLGVVLEDLLVTMLLIAVYYLFSDVLLMGQTLYYRKLYKPAGEKVPGERDPLLPEESSSSSESRSTLVDVSARTRKTIRIFTALSLFLSTATLVGACLYFFGDPDNQVDLSQWHLVPQLLGWASALLYCCSRIPQIMQNFKTESVDGLSILMFIFSVTGNVTYCVSIFCKSIDRTYLLINFPWLLGSGGTLFFDFTIFFQFYLYRNRTECPEEDK